MRVSQFSARDGAPWPPRCCELAVPAPTPPGAAFVRRKGGAPSFLSRRGMMFDAMYLAIGFGFLVVAVLYVVACDHL
jgi:hypothetical protein